MCDLLPPKIQQWQSSPCIAEEYNKKSLEKIRRQQQMCQQRLNELYVKHQELNALIERAKLSPIVEAEQEVSLHYFHNPFPHTHFKLLLFRNLLSCEYKMKPSPSFLMISYRLLHSCSCHYASKTTKGLLCNTLKATEGGNKCHSEKEELKLF